jgi:hypothetical protein
MLPAPSADRRLLRRDLDMPITNVSPISTHAMPGERRFRTPGIWAL